MHYHTFEPTDTQGHWGECIICGAHWNMYNGWYYSNKFHRLHRLFALWWHLKSALHRPV